MWISSEDNAVGYAVPFRALTMHAISRDTGGGFPAACIYTQVEGPTPEGLAAAAAGNGAAAGSAAEEDDDDDDGYGADDEMTELRLVPEDQTKLDEVTQCELTHPADPGLKPPPGFKV